MTPVFAWILGCADAARSDPAHRPPPACLTESEAAVLARHLAALDGLARLAADPVTGRPIGFAALAGSAPLGPIPLQGACETFDTGTPCGDEVCWSTRCEASGWTAHAAPTLQPDAGWAVLGGDVSVRWTRESPEALACSAVARVTDADGADWSVRQHLTLADGRVAVAERYDGLRAGWEVLLRAAGGIGVLEAEGHLLATVEGHAVRPACDP